MRLLLPILLPWLALAEGAAAQPTTGSLVGKLDGDPMLYECYGTAETDKIQCDFVQVLLSNREGPEDLEEALKGIPELVEDKDGEMAKMCAVMLPQMASILEKIDRGEPIVEGTPLPEQPEDLDYLRRSIVVWDTFCKERSPENAEAFLRLSHEQAAKTCTPFINKYSQTFVKVNEDLWVAESSPSGECGIVQVSRFVMPEEGSDFLWEYIAQKAVTNKTGSTALGVQCSDLDEREILYSWRGGPQRIDCVYID